MFHIVIMLLISNVVIGSSGREMFVKDMKAMKDKVAVDGRMSAEILVSNKKVQGFMPEIRAVLHRNKDNVYYKILQLEYLFTNKHTIMVDHKTKSISYAGKEKNSLAGMQSLMPELDSVVAIYDSVVYIGMVQNKRKYCIYNNRALISKTELYFDPATNFVSKLIYHYNSSYIGEEATVVVEYLNVVFNPAFPENEFNENRFILPSKAGEWIPVPRLREYTVYKAETDLKKF